MRKLLTILGIALLACIGIYWFIKKINKETITKKTLTINNCNVHYVHFKNDNIEEIIKTHGHAYNNIMELGEAKIEIGKCLCDSYLNKKNKADSIEILKILHSEEYIYMKDLFFKQSYDFIPDSVEHICKNQDKYFCRIVMD